MEIIFALIAISLFVLYAIGKTAGGAEERADEMFQNAMQEKADAEAWERLTR